nr:DUF4358 domain-containing protein [Clostridia bacterium]
MKKVPLLLLVICLALTGCSSREAAPLTTAGIAEAVAKSTGFVALTDANENYLEKYLMIEADDLASWVMRRDATRATPEMILVLEVRTGADQAAIKQAVMEYHDEQIFQYRDYQPGQVYKLENAKVLENGAFIVLAVAPDAAKVNAALGNGWK